MTTQISIRRVILIFLVMVMVTTVTVSILAGFGTYNKNCELLTHFRVQYLLVSVLVLGWTIYLKKPKVILLTLAWFLYLAIPVVPYYLPPAGSTSKVGTPLKILQLNVLLDNQQHQKVINLIRKENPDIIALEEVTDNWISALKAIEKNYPYRISNTQVSGYSAFGIALYSKYPLTDPKFEYYGRFLPSVKSNIPSISALIHIEHQPIRLIVTHPVPPNVFEYRNSQLASMAADRKRYEKNLIIMGDLNTSQWSPYFQKLIQQTGLRDSQLGFGVQPSWPNRQWWIRTPIDHILVSPDIQVLSRSIGSEVGSDHLPVLAQIALKTP